MANFFPIARDIAMTSVVSVESAGKHTHAIALFAVYIFLVIRYFRTETENRGSQTNELKTPSTGFSKANPPLPSASKQKAPPRISDETLEVLNNGTSLTRSTSILFSYAKEIRFDFEDTISRFEDLNSSLVVQSTSSERQRFLVACNGDVVATTKRLGDYLDWNRHHVNMKRDFKLRVNSTGDRDRDLWIESCLTAMKSCGEVDNVVLPRIIRSQFTTKDGDDPNFVDGDGHRTFCIRPGLMDLNLAQGTTYTLAIAIYLDRSMDRDQLEKVTVCLDVRAGRGWPNTHVLGLIPFIKESLRLLLPLFPERLHKALVYPVPSAFQYIWRLVSNCMDPETVKRVCILEGTCKIDAPPPTKLLRMHFGDRELEQLEASRVKSFKC